MVVLKRILWPLLFLIWANVAVICEEAETAAGIQHLMTDVELFDRSRLLEVDIEIDEANWDKLRFQSRQFATALMKPAPPSPYSWVKAKRVTINGHDIHDVAIRKKGFIGSQDTERPSLKIKFDEYKEQAPIAGIDRLTLNNNKQDRGFISQALAYQLFAEAELPASRCSLAKVTVNGVLLGIYSNVESVKKDMLQRNFGNSSGKLYEGTVVDFVVGKLDGFEAKTDAEDDRAELTAIAELTAGDGELDMKSLNQLVDVDEFIRFWALESLIGFWDGYTNNQNNYFVYANAADSKVHFMPWGIDAAFSYEGGAKMFKKGPDSVHSQAFLPNRLYNTDGVAERYREVMLELLDSIWDEDKIVSEIDRIEEIVKDHIHESQADFSKAMEHSRNFVKTRRKRITRELDDWPKRIAGRPRTPFYTAKIGKAIGKFDTTWLAKKPKEPYELGEAELELTLDGKPVKFLRLGVHAILSDDRGMDGKKPPTVVFVGKRESNKIKVTLGVGTDAENFEKASGQPVSAQGVLMEGAWFLGGFRMLGGTITLDEAGMEPGDVVRGKLEVDVVQFKGDMR